LIEVDRERWTGEAANGEAGQMSKRQKRKVQFKPGDVGEHGKFIYREARETDVKKALCDTLEKLSTQPRRQGAVAMGVANMVNWRAALGAAGAAPRPRHLHLCLGDWGDVTRQVTKAYGVEFAVLNMANEFYFGGAYEDGLSAQEENMFARTNCHWFHSNVDRKTGKYTRAGQRLLSGKDGVVYLDMSNLRVCVTGSRENSYRQLDGPDVFVFHELRAAAQDMRGRQMEKWDQVEAKKRIDAQLATCKNAGVRHVVLGAFGCGAFENPTPDVARAYMEALGNYREDFDVVAFAIYPAYYDRQDNYEEFVRAFTASTEADEWELVN
jgi:uncharacterized protein (TIGR02452 family)